MACAPSLSASCQPLRVLFVCLGNICRSPLAELALRNEAARCGLDVTVDSAGTGNWHVGDPPDPRTIAVAARNDSDASMLRARQVGPADFARFDWIVAMDRQNLSDLEGIAPPATGGRLRLALDFVDGRLGQSVADPYHGDAADFDVCWSDVAAIAAAMAVRIADRNSGQPSG